MSANTVYVTNIAPQASEKEIKEFFSFCGKITNLEVKPAAGTQDATVIFEKPTAAKTALLLDHTQLGATQVHVSSNHAADEAEHYTTNAERDSDEITQEEKPRSRIIAEYLAHGYVIGDAAAQRAIDLDQKHGVSSRFLQTLQKLDAKYKTTDRARAVDQTYGVTPRVNSLLSGLTSYYEKAAGTPTGQKLVNFYTQTSQQVQDIHAEARRLADLKKKDAGVTSTTTFPPANATSSVPSSAHDAATEGTSIISSSKIDPVAPTPAGATYSVPQSAHAAATENTGIVDSAKVDPLAPAPAKTA